LAELCHCPRDLLWRKRCVNFLKLLSYSQTLSLSDWQESTDISKGIQWYC
jgi:hypothetical protein